MKNSPDKPFRVIGGKSSHVAIYNRIACLARVKYLTGVELQRKPKAYLYALDLEMAKKWYGKGPKNKVIDEEFCQRMATIVKEMEKDAKIYENTIGLGHMVASAYKEHKILPEDTSTTSTTAIWTPTKKVGPIQYIINKLKGGGHGKGQHK